MDLDVEYTVAIEDVLLPTRDKGKAIVAGVGVGRSQEKFVVSQSIHNKGLLQGTQFGNAELRLSRSTLDCNRQGRVADDIKFIEDLPLRGTAHVEPRSLRRCGEDCTAVVYGIPAVLQQMLKVSEQPHRLA